jgi:hypothetical protein
MNWDAAVPLVIAIGGGLWALFVYLTQRRIEVTKPFLQKQLELYFETVQVLGKLYTLDTNSSEWKEAERRFWCLYWAELPMVEHDDVEDAMVEFGDELKQYKLKSSQEERNRLMFRSFNLAHAIRRAIEGAWNTHQKSGPPRRVDPEWLKKGRET